MLDKRVLGIKERLVGHLLFLPQEVVRCEVWIDDIHEKRSSWDFTQMNGCNILFNYNLWLRVIGTFVVPDQPSEISSLKSIIN
jgi:hypothetical protein